MDDPYRKDSQVDEDYKTYLVTVICMNRRDGEPYRLDEHVIIVPKALDERSAVLEILARRPDVIPEPSGGFIDIRFHLEEIEKL